jgi:hypothetical protein
MRPVATLPCTGVGQDGVVQMVSWFKKLTPDEGRLLTRDGRQLQKRRTSEEEN